MHLGAYWSVKSTEEEGYFGRTSNVNKTCEFTRALLGYILCILVQVVREYCCVITKPFAERDLNLLTSPFCQCHAGKYEEYERDDHTFTLWTHLLDLTRTDRTQMLRGPEMD